MNKRETQGFIKKYARLAAHNHYEGRVSRDWALGQLGILGQLALVGINDRPYYERITNIAGLIREGFPLAANTLAEASWAVTAVEKPL